MTTAARSSSQGSSPTTWKFAYYVEKLGEDPTANAARIKLIPGITQTERRLEAPLQHMMNAYTASCKALKGVSFQPQRKTLTLTDDKGAWMGRVKYTRKGHAFSTVSPQANWVCVVQLPSEVATMILTSWKDTWSSQPQKQAPLTDAEEVAAIEALSTEQKAHWTKALTMPRPEYNEGEDAGIPQWKLRYQCEFPWDVEFEELAPDHPERKAYVELRTVEELMREMTADQEMQNAANKGDAWANSKWAAQEGAEKAPQPADMAVDSGATGSATAASASAST